LLAIRSLRALIIGAVATFAGPLLLYLLASEGLVCARNSAALSSAAQAAAHAGAHALKAGGNEQAIQTEVQRYAGLNGFGPASGVLISVTIPADRKSVAVAMTRSDSTCFFERAGLVADKRTAQATASTEPAERAAPSGHSICFNLFPC
jgi:hypothetical protein